MKKLICSLFLAFACISVQAAEESLTLQGRVKEAIGRTDLLRAYVLLYDSAGNVRDSIQTNKGYTYRSGVIDTLSSFFFSVPRVDSTYVFDVVCQGYNPQTVSYSVANIGKRERWRDIPIIYMERAPVQLNELTVTSSKVKFYNKGDTLVYDAAAFQLAEGSMLDALIAQLPGVELNDDGQIKVNGEFVESLLLNGKEFMDGNNNLMLENIGAYTVKNIEVYEGQTRHAKERKDIAAPKVLTMDVRLKKEYNIGWIINAQGGYGTKDRYMGRLFASWFNPTTRVSFIGNVNNLNDNRKPGRNDTWTPEKMPSGEKEYRMAGVDYNYQNAEETDMVRGNLMFEQTLNNMSRTTARTNFLDAGDTYDRSFGDGNSRETKINTSHSFFHSGDLRYGVGFSGGYTRRRNSQSDLSATFSDEPSYITPEILEAIYSDGSPEMLQNIINRSKTRSDGWSRNLEGNISTYFGFKLPRSEDNLSLTFDINYVSNKEELWRDYNVNFGSDPNSAIRRRHYTDNSPNHRLNFVGRADYQTILKDSYLSINYKYIFNDDTKDSYMYSLERLGDMGVYGIVPVNYLEAFDPANSYTSRTLEQMHELNLFYTINKEWNDNTMLSIRIRPEISLIHRNLDYWRDNRSYKLSKSNVTLNLSSIWDAMAEIFFGRYGEGRRRNYRNAIRYSYRIQPTLPDMLDLVDVVNDADPLNVYYGNPNLKVQNSHRHLVRWSYSPQSHTFNNILYLGYNHTSNALTRGYTYDMTTGVRHNRMYNVSGNRMAAVTNEINWQFGSTKQFTLSSETDANFTRSADMIGTGGAEPTLTRVDNRALSEKVRLSWQFAGQSISLRCDYTNRHTTSSQPDFRTLDADHVNYGISGVFRLPAGFGISTDFTCYTRRGYGVSYLDTTDPVWNARLSYTHPRHSRWVFMLDGFDLLHKLSNVSYAVTASGRTVSYTNALPRYVLCTIQYRLNIQPRKK